MLLQLASLFIAIVSVLSAQSGVRIAAVDYNPPQPSLTLREGDVDRSPLRVRGDRGVTTSILSLSAQSAFLIDAQSGRILYEKNADEVRPIASITKLMTALVVLDRVKDSPSAEGLSFDDLITFSAQDRRNGGISYLIPGEEISVQDAWKLMLVGSSNDAAALLARVSAGDEAQFVEKMNEKARALGLRYTVFADPTGLHAGNVSTAREVSALTRFALSHPEIRSALGMRQFQFAPQGRTPRIVRSTNWLVGASVAPGAAALGGKTGHIEASGYNFAFAQGNSDQELVGVVLGAESNEARFREMREMMEWGFGVAEDRKSP